MKNTKLLLMSPVVAIMAIGSLAGCTKKNGENKYDKEGRLILDLKNVYFDQWQGADTYTDIINEKFNVKIKASGYSYESWSEQVNVAINGDNLTDTIHYELKDYNFGASYEEWVDNLMIKALPDDMSKWPNLQAMLAKVSNLNSLKINGKLYGIPCLLDLNNPEKDFSNFTYVYRRDWAKKIDEANKNKAGYTPIYKEGDVYTWDEFNRLLKAFSTEIQKDYLANSDQAYALADEAWGFPSVTNFYKDAPHCFTKDANGKAVNAFTTDNYLAGLEVAKDFVSKRYYSPDQFNYKDGTAKKKYIGGLAGVFYDNFSLSNYLDLRTTFRNNNRNTDLDDGTALMKVKDPNGVFSLESTENWYGITLFNYNIKDEKMEKILDIMDYLLTEEGTRLAIYGKEGYDYEMVDGKVQLNEINWEKDSNTGKLIKKENGAKYLRYMATLGNDTKSYDPYTDMDTYNIIKGWQDEMATAKANNQLRVFRTPVDIAWMSTPTKNEKTQDLLGDGNNAALKYAFSKLDKDAYLKVFSSNKNWERTLNEINAKLGK